MLRDLSKHLIPPNVNDHTINVLHLPSNRSKCDALPIHEVGQPTIGASEVVVELLGEYVSLGLQLMRV